MKLSVNEKDVPANLKTLASALKRMSAAEYGVVILEDEATGSYVQALCSKKQGLAEARVCNGKDFSHYRAGLKKTDKTPVKIGTKGFVMNSFRENLLDIDLIKTIFADFLENGSLYSPDDKFEWTDVTEEFRV